MIENLVVEPMTEQCVLWRCLHGGPLSCDTIDQWSSEDEMPWKQYQERNYPLLTKLTKIYGACAIIARKGNEIIGQLRFYPKFVYGMEGAGNLCLQQNSPAGPDKNFTDSDFPDPSKFEDKTLLIHCMMTGSSLQKKNPYRRKGIGTRMVKVLIEWAKANGWKNIEAESFEDIPIIYDITGSAGHTFWEKLGFHLVDRHPHPELQDSGKYTEFVMTLEEQTRTMGIHREKAKDRLVMRLDVT